MPFLRFTRDRHGYENTFLLHTAQPGESPRVLYWYRSAPGVRVGRPALDEDAIRTIEEQHPEVEFDWPQILEVGAATQPEVERKPVRQPRRPQPQRPREDAAPAYVPESQPEAAEDVVEELEPAPAVEDESEEEPDEALRFGARP